MEEEITEVTHIVRKKKEGPSFWFNLITLGFLITVIVAAQQWITQERQESLPTEDMEKEIVLEDLESPKPLVESELVTVPTVEEGHGEKVIPAKAGIQSKPLDLRFRGDDKRDKPVPTKKLRAQKRVKKVYESKYAHDPFTDGSAQDLDRPENWQTYFPGRPKEGVIKEKVPVTKEATATPVLPTQKETFIPFESN